MRRRALALVPVLALLACGEEDEPTAPVVDAADPLVESVTGALPRYLGAPEGAESAPPLAEARALLGAGRLDDARERLEALVEDDASGEAAFLLGWLHLRADRFAAARPHLARALELGPGFPKAKQVFYMYGRALQETGELEAARAAYEADGRLFPEGADGLHRLALLDLEEGALERCEERARKCLERFERPRDVAKARVLLAEVHLARGELEEARAELERAVSAFPHYEAFYKLSRLCARLGDEEAAERYLAEHERWRAEAGR